MFTLRGHPFNAGAIRLLLLMAVIWPLGLLVGQERVATTGNAGPAKVTLGLTFGAHNVLGAERKPAVVGSTLGGQQFVSNRAAVRLGGSVVRYFYGGYHMECRLLPDGGCAPPPRFPRAIWSLEGGIAWSLTEDRNTLLLLGAGAALPQGDNGASDPGGVTALWRAGIELGATRRVGLHWTVAGYGRSVLDASTTMTGGIVIRMH